MESILKKFEKNSVNMSQIYGAQSQAVSTGRGLWGSSSDMTVSGSEYAIFDGDCCYRYFVPDNGGGVRWLPAVC